MAVQADGRVLLGGKQLAEVGPIDALLSRYLPSAPAVASASASPAAAPAGANVALAASVAPGNPGALGGVTRVAFYVDSNGDGKLEAASDTRLGYATYNAATGQWELTISTTGWAQGSYRLFAQAEDGYGAFGDPFSLTLDLV